MAVLLLLVVCIFAVLGLQLFSGRFYSCNDATVAGKAECTGTFLNDMGEEVSRIWSRPFFNFDSFGNSLFALFVCSTLDGYQPIMQSAIAAPSIKGTQPSSGSHGTSGMFFVVYIVISVFVMLNLFVGASCLCSTPDKWVDHALAERVLGAIEVCMAQFNNSNTGPVTKPRFYTVTSIGCLC